jgi:hypothetical protein
MLDEDMQTKYYNLVLRREEWRCRYYSSMYLFSSNISKLRNYLQDTHKLLQESKRDTKAQNI